MASSTGKERGKGDSATGPTERAAVRLESGAAFMPDASLKRLEKAARGEKNPRAKFRRWHAWVEGWGAAYVAYRGI